MISAGFLITTERAELIDLTREGLVENRVARCANALVLLDDDTVRTWFRLYMEDGIEGLRLRGQRRLSPVS